MAQRTWSVLLLATASVFFKAVRLMRSWKTLFAALVVLAGLSTSASSQQFAVGGGRGNGFGGGQGFGYGGTGFNNGFNSGFGGTGFNNGFNNLNGYNGIGSYNAGYTYYRPIPQTTNNMFGLMNSIQTQTGGGNSYRRGSALGSRRR